MQGKKKIIPNKLRYFRKLSGYQQKDIAFLLGIKGAGRISEWEQGTSNPSLENLIKLSLIYQRLPDQLYNALRTKCAQEIAERRKHYEELRNLFSDTGG